MQHGLLWVDRKTRPGLPSTKNLQRVTSHRAASWALRGPEELIGMVRVVQTWFYKWFTLMLCLAGHALALALVSQ